ncbi:integrase [Prevotella herbatica]|uniref:Integrase n=1 Tax=Prevotella herbatica TaxID=2801997 RepID=A0ABN6EFW3_9BACT|nr:integrase [Prevotella herbatica]
MCEYLGRDSVGFGEITPRLLKSYEQYLIRGRHKLNTISTYMRMLRAIYNKAVDAGHTKYIHHLFHKVYTGIDRSHKKALEMPQLRVLLNGVVRSRVLNKVQQTACVMYKLCGMPYVDLQQISMDSITDGALSYCRRKTGTSVNVPVNGDILRTLRDLDLGNSDMNTESGYRRYQSLLRKFNAGLSRLARKLGIKGHVSSYTLRHSWATTALHSHVPVELISSALGHSDIRTTQIYLKGFNVGEIEKANRKILRYMDGR